MTASDALAGQARQRTLHFLAHPEQWPLRPMLPVVRRKAGSAEEELGVVLDALHALELPGYTCTVWKVNLFELPPTLDEFLQLPHETFDTPDELADAGWRVD